MKNAFGIIEVVVSVGIMIIIVSGAAILEKNAIRNSVIASERTQAYNLAREGIEAVRAIRDTHWIDKNPETVWNADFTTGSDFSVCLLGNECKPVSGLFISWALSSGAQSINLDGREYTRSIQFENISAEQINEINKISSLNIGGQLISPIINGQAVDFNNYAIEVTVSVKWQSYGRPLDVISYEYLTDWKPVY